MPRPKGRQLPYRVSVALTAEQHAGLDELARANGAAVSWVVRLAVIEFLEQNGPGAGRGKLSVQLRAKRASDG